MSRRLKLTEDGFTQDQGWWTTKRLRWKDIRRVIGIKQDMITYEDCFLMLASSTTNITVSSADEGFGPFEVEMLRHLEDFPADWEPVIQAEDLNVRVLLWSK